MSIGFWAERTVLVTGHTGFKGSWLCLYLERLGARVVGYALAPPTQPSLFELAGIESSIVSVRGDVRDVGALEALIERHHPDVIFHLAAQSSVLESYSDPIETYSTNVVGTACLFEALRRSGKRCAVVNVTTDKCYRNREWLWGYREADELGGHDPYSNSKACAELATQSFRDSFFPEADFERHGVCIATARAGNVIGGGDWTRDQLIPDIMRAFAAGVPVRIRSPNAVRPWQHVLDCLGGYLLLGETLCTGGVRFSGAYNFGPALDDSKPVSWIVEKLVRAWGDGAAWTMDRSDHPHEAAMLRLDSTKSSTLLGWRPKLDLSTALQWTVDWYRAWGDGVSARELCSRQIDAYLESDAQ